MANVGLVGHLRKDERELSSNPPIGTPSVEMVLEALSQNVTGAPPPKKSVPYREFFLGLCSRCVLVVRRAVSLVVGVFWLLERPSVSYIFFDTFDKKSK